MLTIAMLAAALALLVPEAASHPLAGLPKDWCEDLMDYEIHEYSGFGHWERNTVSVDGQDLVIGYTYAPLVPVDGSHLSLARDVDVDCSSLILTDAHSEFAVGGAVLAGEGGLGGAVQCLGEIPHHAGAWWTTIYVQDSLLGNAIDFTVVSDWPRAGQEALFPCGDGILEPCPDGGTTSGCNPNDEWTYGFGGSVSPLFGVGANGAYYVFIEGTTGHVWTYP